MRNPNTVTIIQRVLPHYRVSFFKQLNRTLVARGIDLQLVYGQEKAGSVPKSVSLNAPWVRRVSNMYLEVGGTELVWQRGAITSIKSSLVIVEQSNRLLLNLILLALRPFAKFKVAFWGHGRNFQSRKPGISEQIKRLLIRHVDWWFAYTAATAAVVEAAGFPPERVTNVQNSIDTSALEANLRECAPAEIAKVGHHFELMQGFVGLYCGGMYAHKQLPFLIDACIAIKDRIPEFSMLFVGDGPDDDMVKDATKKHSWMHYVGPKYGADLAPFYRVSNVFLLPGALGLAVIDSFVVGVPIFTTASAKHGPERDFLESGVNGVVTSDSVRAYADAVADYFCDKKCQEHLRQGLAISKEQHSIEVMVERFAEGIAMALRDKVS